MKLYWRLVRYLAPYRRVFAASLALMVVSAALDGFSMILLVPFLRSLFGMEQAIPGVGGNAIDRLLDWTVGGWLSVADPMDALRNVCVLLLVVLLAKNAALYGARYFGVVCEEGIVRDMRSQLYAHLQRLPLGYFHRTKVGQLISRVFSDTAQTKQIVSYAIADVLRHVVSLGVFVVTLFGISWKLTLLALGLAPVLLVALRPLLGRLRRGFRKAFDEHGELTSLLQETASGARLVKSYGAESYETRRFDHTNDRYTRRILRTLRWHLLAHPASEVFGAALTLVLVFAGARFVFAGELPAEQFVLFLTIALRMQSPLKALSTFPARAQQSLAAAERFFEILDLAPEPGGAGKPERGRRLEGFEDRIVYEGVSFAYDGGEPVLRGLSFEVRKGEVVALVGPSGAGKTTVVDLLPRFYEPGAGRICIDGVDLCEYSLASVRACMAIVPQETVIFHDTVRANIAYGQLERYHEAQIETAARAANAGEFILALPQGYDTLLGERGVRLSGGQRQRIAIARAILRDPPILILDEATSALDSESERLVQEAIERLLANRTVIVIAHRLSTVQGADRILVLDGGQIVERGTHEELLARGGLYRRLYELQFETATGVQAG
ncbi:MAG: ABC transporter ATP-binding protein [Gemmatimonadetes bacterium]|nr:ABC transporter ATP-binding protein [Gemmatimonadota bacterium]